MTKSFTEPGLILNTNSVVKRINVTGYLKPNSLEKPKMILWHDLINNTSTPHRANIKKHLTTDRLLDIDSFEKLFSISYSERACAPKKFQELQARNVFVVDVTVHILRRTEQIKEVIVKKYREQDLWVWFSNTALISSGFLKLQNSWGEFFKSPARSPASVLFSNCISFLCPLLECAPCVPGSWFLSKYGESWHNVWKQNWWLYLQNLLRRKDKKTRKP